MVNQPFLAFFVLNSIARRDFLRSGRTNLLIDITSITVIKTLLDRVLREMKLSILKHT